MLQAQSWTQSRQSDVEDEQTQVDRIAGFWMDLYSEQEFDTR